MTGAVGKCSPCLVDFYRDELAGPHEACSPCPPYSQTRSLATDTIAGCICLSGARRNSSAVKSDGYVNLCVSCPAGYSADLNSAEGLCTPCLAGAYRPADATPSQPCINCPPNTRSLYNASTLLSDCLCVPGCAPLTAYGVAPGSDHFYHFLLHRSVPQPWQARVTAPASSRSLSPPGTTKTRRCPRASRVPPARLPAATAPRSALRAVPRPSPSRGRPCARSARRTRSPTRRRSAVRRERTRVPSYSAPALPLLSFS